MATNLTKRTSIQLQTDFDSLSLICLREFEPARLVAIFRSIYEGKTPVYVQQSGHLLGHILAVPANAVVDGSVGHMKHTPRPPSLLSNEEAAKELDCSIPYLLKLLQRGLLRNSQGSEARNGIFLQDVLAFQREYQFAEDAARAHAIPLKEIELWSCYIPSLVVMRFHHADTPVLVLRRTIVTFILNHRLPLDIKDLQSCHLPFKGNVDYQTIMQVQYILGRLIRSDDSSLIVPPTFQYLPFLVMWRNFRNLGVNQLARKAGITASFKRMREAGDSRSAAPSRVHRHG